MVYVTVKQPPIYHQMTLEEFLFHTESKPVIVNENLTNTHTYAMTNLSQRFIDKFSLDLNLLITRLEAFNAGTAELREKPRRELYREFYIPKKSGGLRKIDAPNAELMNALRLLKLIFERDFGVLYHTSAFAYVKGRSTLDSIKRHQMNESKWFAKYDLSNFFGNTTLDFVIKMFSMIFPFSEVVKSVRGKEALTTALELAFLDGGLPQGTPLSPLITNVMMIPIDHALSNSLRDFERQRFIYTRYADDFLISSRYDFSFRVVEKHIVKTLEYFNAPFTIKSQKTRYGSSSGANWNLGVMLNKDNQITIGHKKKRQFQAMLTNYVLDSINGKPWDTSDIRVMDGYRNYYRMVEGETIDNIIKHIGDKYKVNIMDMIKKDLRA